MDDNIQLITKNRIDIVIGIEYVDFYENKYNTEFFIDLHMVLIVMCLQLIII